jgi:glucose/arabinose dehydrogenase
MVFSSGLSDVTGLCVAGDQKIYASDDLPDSNDQLDQLSEGDDHGYPTPQPDSSEPVTDFPGPDGGLGGCAAAGSTVFLGALDGQRVYVVSLGHNGQSTGDPQDFLKGQYGRLRSVAMDPQGALWITTSNKDGVGTPKPDDDKVLRIVPPTDSGNSPL